MNDNQYNGLFTKHEVKMAGYWSSLFCMCIDQDSVQVQNLLINNANNELFHINFTSMQIMWPTSRHFDRKNG